MNICLSITALILVSATQLFGNAQAAQPMKFLERSYELYTLELSLPRAVPSRLTVRPCLECTPDTLQLANSSLFYIGREAVPYAQFATHAKTRSYSLTIHYTPETKVVTRMVAAAN